MPALLTLAALSSLLLAISVTKNSYQKLKKRIKNEKK